MDIENFTLYVILNLWALNLDCPHFGRLIWIAPTKTGTRRGAYPTENGFSFAGTLSGGWGAYPPTAPIWTPTRSSIAAVPMGMVLAENPSSPLSEIRATASIIKMRFVTI